MNRQGTDECQAYSAGSRPGSAPHRYTRDLLRGRHHDTSFAQTKIWGEFARPDAPQMDFVFAACDNAAAEEGPFRPGQPMSAPWGADPVKVEGPDSVKRFGFSKTYRTLRNRISIFVGLPPGSHDRMALQRNLDGLGRFAAKAD
ncbi:arsenate reductase ArsC [Pseudooceanicola sp.]|uniref:arsenate reductase ArsC n=1 Tax=Pseudooceanicola sp. TaxID=1914328 RepID=UPI0026248E23|nr:arsenate reductase ArsC [Pseudooceanicola sp.]MDF1856617.1 arsenate reductase ArsC [Pseudooceanicola sp.]